MVGFFEYYFKLQFIVRFGECILGKILSWENDNLRCCRDISSSKNRARHRKSPPGKIAIPMKKTLHHGNNSICSPKYLTPPPPPPIISTSLENSTATFRIILTTHACNHLNQTPQTKYQPLYEKIANFSWKLSTPTDCRRYVTPSQKIAIPDKYLNNPE